MHFGTQSPYSVSNLLNYSSELEQRIERKGNVNHKTKKARKAP